MLESHSGIVANLSLYSVVSLLPLFYYAAIIAINLGLIATQ